MSESHRSQDGRGGRKQLGWVIFGLLLLVCLPAAAAPTEVIEGGSGQHFQSPLLVVDKSYTLVGTGLHKKGPDKYYAMALYVHDSARQSFPSVYDRANRTHNGLFLENRAQNFFVWGHFSKLALLRFLRPVAKDELLLTLREGLSDILSAQAPADLRKDAQSFLALFDSDLKEGQELRIYTDDAGHVDVIFDGKTRSGPQNARLSRHVWEIWLGSHPVAKEMHNSLLDRLDVLAR